MKINDYSEDMWYVGLGGSVSMAVFTIISLIVGNVEMLFAGLIVFIIAAFVMCVGFALELRR